MVANEGEDPVVVLLLSPAAAVELFCYCLLENVLRTAIVGVINIV